MSNVYPFLEFLSRLNSADRTLLIPYLNGDGCESIYECVHNGLWSKALSIKKRKEIKKNLKQDEKHFRCILNGDVCSQTRQKRLTQVGGNGLGLILTSVLPLLAEHLRKK